MLTNGTFVMMHLLGSMYYMYLPRTTDTQCTKVRFVSLLSGGFITAIVVNPPERKLAKHTSVNLCGFDPGLEAGSR